MRGHRLDRGAGSADDRRCLSVRPGSGESRLVTVDRIPNQGMHEGDRFGREKPTRYQLVGSALGLAGCQARQGPDLMQ